MNFILRTFTNECRNPLNRIIGNTYVKKHKKFNEDQWDNIIKDYFPDMKKELIKTVECLVIYGEAVPIYEDMKAYIMTDEGQTFERLN